MDPIFDCLSDIKPGKEAWRIRVRVVRLWKVPGFLNPGQTNSLEMVLVDEKGVKIHASVRRQLLYLFEGKLFEGQVYKMSFFGVVPVSGSYRTACHEFKLMFQMKTKVQVTECSSISVTGLSLKKCSDIKAFKEESPFLIDLIGLLSGMSPAREYVRDGKMTKMMVVEITDDSGKVDCALFGDYVDELKSLMDRSGEGMPVLVIQFAKIKIFRDNASIQNVMAATRILVNPEIPEAVDFKNGIAVHGIESSCPVAVIQPRARISKEDDFLRLFPKKTVSGLKYGKEDGVFVVCASILGLVEGSEFWYPSCVKCNKKVSPDSGSYYCDDCVRHVYQIVPRFKVDINVGDGKENAVFVLFDSDVHFILGKSCSQILDVTKAENGVSYPAEFDVLVGKKLLFKVERRVYGSFSLDGSFKVKRICDDDMIIKAYEREFGSTTPSEVVRVDFGGSSSFQPSSSSTALSGESVEITAEAVLPSLALEPSFSLADDSHPFDPSQFVDKSVKSPGASSVVVQEGVGAVVSAEKTLSAPYVSGKRLRRSGAVKNSVKRNLSNVFEGLGDLDVQMPLKVVKTEKD